MRRFNFLIIGLVALIATIISCNNDKPNISTLTKQNPEGSAILIDSLVYGISTHPSENIDPYENEAFKSFLQDKLINHIFEQIYSGKIKAFDFFTDKELTIKEVKELEKKQGFSRSKVGKVQFDEQWYFDKNGVLNKRVNSMTFGVESYSNTGNFVDYNALFKIKF
jgi:hypothetical protein